MAFYVEREGKYLEIWEHEDNRLSYHWSDCSVDANPFGTMEDARRAADECCKWSPGPYDIRKVAGSYAEKYAVGEIVDTYPHWAMKAMMDGVRWGRKNLPWDVDCWCIPNSVSGAAAESYWVKRRKEMEEDIGTMGGAAIKNLFLAGVSFAETQGLEAEFNTFVLFEES